MNQFKDLPPIKRAMYYISFITLFLSFVFLGAVGVWLFYPYKLVDFKSPFIVTDKTLHRGDLLEYKFDYCKYTTLDPIEVKREYIDGIIFISSDSRANVKFGCNTAVVRNFIPETLPNGNYKMKITVIYKPNPIRTIVFTNETEWFQILEEK